MVPLVGVWGQCPGGNSREYSIEYSHPTRVRTVFWSDYTRWHYIYTTPHKPSSSNRRSAIKSSSLKSFIKLLFGSPSKLHLWECMGGQSHELYFGIIRIYIFSLLALCTLHFLAKFYSIMLACIFAWCES